jgi:starch synthase
MRVLFATAEFAPLVRVGGLAAATAGLVAELRRQGTEVDVVLPDYFDTPLAGQTVLPLDVPEWAQPAAARTGTLAGAGQITLITCAGIRRSHPYVQPSGVGWADNDRRFMSFSAGVAALTVVRAPDVLHLNDWHTAATLGHLAAPPPTVLTVHTLGYQGQCHHGWLQALPYRAEAYDEWGDCNPLAGAIRLADLVVAVSPHYAAEITTPQYGFGLDHLLRDRGPRLVGILNGIDDREWDPAVDPHLDANYSASDLSGKVANRAAVLARCGLPPASGPLVAMVTRLVDQKGVDLAAACAPFLQRMHASMVILGDGDDAVAELCAAAAARHPGEVAFVRGYDNALAHLLFAGADVLVMPSRFEPCGLAQMQAMRYGTLPLVTDVGGLHDTVVDVDDFPAQGTGVVAPRSEPLDVLDGLHRMCRSWGQVRRRAAMQRRGMTTDWSWRAPAAEHVQWYGRLQTGV